jgi:hypothetical protein
MTNVPNIPEIKARRLTLAEVVGALRAGRDLVTTEVMGFSQQLANWSEGVDHLLADPDIDRALADILALVQALEEAQNKSRREPVSERIRLWCTIHHFFHRDCADCLDKDYAALERQLAEAQGKLDAVERVPVAHQRIPGAAMWSCYDHCTACARACILEGE